MKADQLLRGGVIVHIFAQGPPPMREKRPERGFCGELFMKFHTFCDVKLPLTRRKVLQILCWERGLSGNVGASSMGKVNVELGCLPKSCQ